MNKEIINTLLLAFLFLLLFGIAEFLHKRLKIKAGSTRKIVHIGTGFLSLLFPVMVGNHWLVLLLCASFAVILFISLQYNFLPSIHAIDRVSYGCLWYPVAVYGCFITYTYFQNRTLFFYLPVLTMAICDPIAAIFGKMWPYGKFYIKKDAKTIMGCTAFFLTSLALTLILFYTLERGTFSLGQAIPFALLIASFTTVTEALSVRGLDNITIPVSVILVLIFLHV